MTGNTAGRAGKVLRRGTLWLVAFCALAGSGCAFGRRSSLPEPRESDASVLRAEATARPTDAEPLYQLALLHLSKSMPDSALGALGAAVARDPQHAPSLALLATLLHRAGRSAEALRWFEARGVSRLPDAVRLDVALLYADVGNTVAARKLLKDLSGGPQATAAAANLAYLDLLDEDNPNALAALEAEAQRFPDSPEVQQNLALARLRTGDVESGVRLLEAVAERHPDFAPAQHNLALVRRHYRFDEEGARRAEARAEALQGSGPSETALRTFLRGTEDAAPAAPPATGAAPRAAAPGEARP